MTTVTIGDREFSIGATYAPRLTAPGPNRIFQGTTASGRVRYDAPTHWGGKLKREIRNPCYWLSWAGDEVQP